MAEERVGVLEPIAETEVFGLPVGAAVTGGLIAGLADGLLALIPIKAPEIAVRGFGAFAMARWGPRWFGKTAANTAALFLTYDAIQSLFDIRGWTRGLFSRLKVGEVGEEEEIELLGAGEEEELLPPELLGAGVGAAGTEKLVLI